MHAFSYNCVDVLQIFSKKLKMMVRRIFFFIIVISLSYQTVVHSEPLFEDPILTANKFYSSLVSLHIRGLPNSKEQQQLRPFLSHDLTHRLKKAQTEQAEFIKQHGNTMKPPWIEGNLFGSLWEGMTDYSIGRVVVSDNKASMPIYLQYGKDDDIVEWIDLLILIKEREGWYVYDIIYGGTWQFRPVGSLLQNLSSS